MSTMTPYFPSLLIGGTCCSAVLVGNNAAVLILLLAQWRLTELLYNNAATHDFVQDGLQIE